MGEFKSSLDRLQSEKLGRIDNGTFALPFGVPFLDKTLGAIRRTDLIMIGAAPGAGKSELATEIITQACARGKRVHMFALEAEEDEVERRILYKAIAEEYFKAGGDKYINYQDWVLERLPFLDDYEEAAKKSLITKIWTLNTFYRDSDFTINEFEAQMFALEGRCDLCVIDHIHYFDFDSENENKAVANIMKKIRDLSLITKIPVILVAHLRKVSGHEKKLVPNLSDFHGTSELGKIATRTVVLAAGPIDGKTNMPITYMRAVKNRIGGERCSAVAKMLYDPKRNCYTKDLKFGYLSHDEKDFIPFDINKPQWLED